MKFHSLAAILISLSLGAEARPEIAGVDPENYVSTKVSAEVAKGGVRKLHDQGVLRSKNEGRSNKRKGNLRSLQTGFDDDYYFDGGAVGTGLTDDQLVTEEQYTIEYYQDNRFSAPEPIFANIQSPSLDASGNRWLYANVPLQPIYGINDLPIQGLAQGFCEGLRDAEEGFCHFTYEFFDLMDGAIVVYASLTAEGSTNTQGTSKLNILGGTGEFSGAVGEVSLTPVGIDESIIPARVFKDGSLFLGNRNGFEAKFDIAVRYLLNAPIPVPVPVAQAVPQSIPAPVTSVSFASANVNCLADDSEFCDCGSDCANANGLGRCDCAEGQACCA